MPLRYVEKQGSVIKMSKKKHLQEIYGEEDDVDVTDEEVANELTKLIAELKEKYGSEWTKHIGEEAD